MADQAVKLDIIIGAVNKARPALNGLKVDLSGITNVARTAATALSRIALGGAALGGGVVTGLGYITKGFAEAAMEAENFKTMLVTALKTPEAADEMFAWAKKFADTTPFDTGPVIDAVTRLVNQGFDPKVWLEPIGNLAAANPSKSIIDAVEAFTDATRGEWERIKEFGLNSAALKQAGWSGKTEDVGSIMSSLRKVLDDRYAGGMARLSKTTAGALSNLRGTIWDLKVAVGSTLLPALNKLTAWLSDNIGRIKEFAKAWSGTLTDVFTRNVTKLLNWLDGKRESIVEWFRAVGQAIAAEWREWMQDDATGTSKIDRALAQAQEFVSYVRVVMWPILKQAWDDIRTSVLPYIDDIGRGIGAVAEWVEQHKQLVTWVIELGARLWLVEKAWRAVTAAAVLAGGAQVAAGAAGSGGAAAAGAGGAAAAGGAGWMAAARTALGAIIRKLGLAGLATWGVAEGVGVASRREDRQEVESIAKQLGVAVSKDQAGQIARNATSAAGDRPTLFDQWGRDRPAWDAWVERARENMRQQLLQINAGAAQAAVAPISKQAVEAAQAQGGANSVAELARREMLLRAQQAAAQQLTSGIPGQAGGYNLGNYDWAQGMYARPPRVWDANGGILRNDVFLHLPADWASNPEMARALAAQPEFANGVVKVVYDVTRQPTRGR